VLLLATKLCRVCHQLSKHCGCAERRKIASADVMSIYCLINFQLDVLSVSFILQYSCIKVSVRTLTVNYMMIICCCVFRYGCPLVPHSGEVFKNWMWTKEKSFMHSTSNNKNNYILYTTSSAFLTTSILWSSWVRLCSPKIGQKILDNVFVGKQKTRGRPNFGFGFGFGAECG